MLPCEICASANLFVHKLVCKGYVDRYIGRGVHKIHMIPISFKSAREEVEKCLPDFFPRGSPVTSQVLGKLRYKWAVFCTLL